MSSDPSGDIGVGAAVPTEEEEEAAASGGDNGSNERERRLSGAAHSHRRLPCGFSTDITQPSACLPHSLFANAGLLQKVGAELVSTYILVFAGCGAAMVDEISRGAVTHLGVSAAFGLVVMIMIYSVGHISGAHMNPAVTLAFATVRHFPWTHR